MTRFTPRTARLLGGACALGLLALSSAALTLAPVSALARQDAAATEEFTLQRVFKKGDIDRYRLALSARINNEQTGNMEVEVVFALRMKETTKEVKEDGSGVLYREFEQGYARIGEAFEQDLTASLPKVTQTIDKTGRVVATKTEGGAGDFASGGPQAFSLAQTAFYPPKPVKVGDKWKIDQGDVKAKEAERRVRFVGEATVVGKETVKGIETLKIKSVAEITPDKASDKMTLDGTSNMDPKTGKIVKIDGVIEGAFGPLGKTKARLTLDMLTDADKAEPKK